MSEAKQHHKSPRAIRLTRNGESAASYPCAGPIPPEEFIPLSGGGLRLQAINEPPVSFAFQVSVDASGFDLQTTGFEGVEVPELQNREVGESAPATIVSAAPNPETTSGIVIPRSPSGLSNTAYEAIEFLDFDEPLFEFESEPDPEPPPMANDLLAFPVRFAAPSPAKMMQLPADVAMPAIPIQKTPALELRPLRRKMVAGINPSKPASEAAHVLASMAPHTAGTPAPAKVAPQVVVRSIPKQPAKPTSAPQQRPGVAAKSLQEPVKAAPFVERKPSPPTPEKHKVPARPTEPGRAAPAPPPKPAIAARDHGNAVPVQRETDVAPAPSTAPKPKLMPIRKPDAPSNPTEAVPMLALGGAAVSAGLSPVAKAAIAAITVIVLGGGGYFAFSGNSTKANSSGPSDIADDITAPGMVMGGGGWTTTWGADAPHNKGKQIAIYRPSMAMTDYRFEFRGQIERKALGWIFRAANARNYYVMKLQTIKPGPNPIVALVKYAVINGKETTRTQVLLPFEVALDTIYHVRFEAKGDKFTTYVQNKLVDYWADDRVKVGGTGFYNDDGERGQIKSSQVSYLVAGK